MKGGHISLVIDHIERCVFAFKGFIRCRRVELRVFKFNAFMCVSGNCKREVERQCFKSSFGWSELLGINSGRSMGLVSFGKESSGERGEEFG